MADKQIRKPIAVEVAAVKTAAPVVVVAPLTDAEQRTALDHKRRALDGSVGPVSTDPNLASLLEAIDRESVALNQKIQDADTKLKAKRS
jgi:hypothetical protein